MGEVADGNGRRRTTVLVEQNNIAEALTLGGPHEFRKDEVSTIETDAGREQEPYLLREGHQPRAGIARCCHQHPRVCIKSAAAGDVARSPAQAHTNNARQLRVLVVDIQRLVRVDVPRHIVVVILAQFLVVRNLRVQGLSGREGCPQLGSFFRNFGVAQEERPAVEVVPPLAGLFALCRASATIFFGGSQELGVRTIIFAPWSVV